MAMLVLTLSMSAMDSNSNLPFYAGITSLAYIVLIMIANNWFEKE